MQTRLEFLDLNECATRKGNVTSKNYDAWIWLRLAIFEMSWTRGSILIQCVSIFSLWHAFPCHISACWYSCHWDEMICDSQHLMTLILHFKTSIKKCYLEEKSRHIILEPRGWCLGCWQCEDIHTKDQVRIVVFFLDFVACGCAMCIVC